MNIPLIFVKVWLVIFNLYREPALIVFMRRILCLFFLSPVICIAQFTEADSLRQIIRLNTEDTIRLEAYIRLTLFYYDTHPDSSLLYARKGYQLAVEKKILPRQAQMLQSIGVSYDYLGNLDSCIHYLNLSNELYKNQGLTDKQSHVISDIAIAWFYRGNYELAIRNHLAALDLRKATGNNDFISKSLNNIGLVYKARKDYATAANYYRQSLGIKEIIGDKKGTVNTLMNLGSMYQSMHNYDSALYFAQRGHLLAKELGLDKDITAFLANRGDALHNLGKEDEAMRFLNTAEQSGLQQNYSQALLTVYHAKGNILLKGKQFVKAEEYFRKGLELAATGKRQEAMMNFCDKLSQVYRQSGKLADALLYSDSSNAIESQLLNEENIRQINEMTAVYEINEKEKQIIGLNADKGIASSLANRRKKERNYFIIASFLFLALTIFAYRAFMSNRKKKVQLGKKNAIIEKALSEKEILMKEIHHRVKNNLQVVSSLLSLQSNYIKDEQALDAITDSRNRVQSMALIHQNLYQENDLTGIDVQDYIGKLCSNLFTSYNIQQEKIKLLKDIEPMVLDVDLVVPVGLVLNELITNSLKYGFAEKGNQGIIKVQLKKQNGHLLLAVYDNGMGLPQNFSRGSNNSFGYFMIEAFLTKLNGTMKTYNEDGTKTEITIPL